ncbi:hypothetical protein QJS10_CPA09g00836 [Acorus calamus]|uniref:Uncharacterized protein n=1 Tax=Acorus calamus TaxID=4465 RepID=A0AAV9E4K5_ACOCL|nr:hypothetical protein QJS10_CPA09g00836 [Acorus calamus]
MEETLKCKSHHVCYDRAFTGEVGETLKLAMRHVRIVKTLNDGLSWTEAFQRAHLHRVNWD